MSVACLRLIIVASLMLLLVACGSSPQAPVSSASKYSSSSYRSTSAKPGYYLVRKGDTLYSIAFKYGLDYKQLARWNVIRSPYLIKVGQRLWLYQRSTGQKISKVNTTSSRHINKKPANKVSTQPSKPVPKVSSTDSAAYKNALKWNWPVKGKVVQRFSPKQGKKGIDIVAASATPIRAAEGGKVVYGGTGLRGYGLMVIIKHNDHYLSAYAHNKELLVKEGDWVKPGQTIARMGKTGTDRIKLHFEIRKSGTPVDPMRYLPN